MKAINKVLYDANSKKFYANVNGSLVPIGGGEIDPDTLDNLGTVKSVSVNGGQPVQPENGNVNLIVTGIKGDKGDKGDTGATGPAGPQGNSGVASADGVIVVNNLTEGGTDVVVDGVTKVKVLSAEMGKEIGDALNELQGIETYGPDAELDQSGHYMNTNGAYYTDGSYSVSRFIHLDAGKTIEVDVPSCRSSSFVIGVAKGATHASGFYTTGSVPFVSGTTHYSYTAPDGGADIAIGYKTSDGFVASINNGTAAERIGNDVDVLEERFDDMFATLGGEEIPFDNPKYYTLNNGNLVENNGNVAGKCSTAKISIAEYEHIYYTGGTDIYGGYFIAVFFDANDTFLGTRYFPPVQTGSDSEPTTPDAFAMKNLDVLANIPSGATKVCLQSNVQLYTTKVIGIKKKPYISVADSDYSLQDLYGVKGDGLTDDTAALQAMLDASWGEINLKPASYLISNTLLLNAMRVKKLSGNGATLILNAGNNSSLIALDVVGDHTGDASLNKSVKQMMSAGIVIEDLHITSLAGMNSLPITNNSAQGSGGNGIGMRIRKCFKPIIRGCKVFMMQEGIIFTEANRNVIIEGCHIYACQSSGIKFAESLNLHQCNIYGNHISYCLRGIDFDNPAQIANFQITGNDIETVGTFPVTASQADKRCIRMNIGNATSVCYEIEICGNTIQGHGNSGGATHLIEVACIDGKDDMAKERSLSITGNHMSNCAGAAVYLKDSTVVSLSGNNVNNAGGHVYLAGTVSALSISGETLAPYETGKYLVDSASDASVSNASVSGCTAKNASVRLQGTLDYISVVGNNLGGGSVNVGNATHKQVENNI